MTDRNIEEHLAAAIEKLTPDISDELIAEIGRIETPAQAYAPAAVSPHRIRRAVMSIAAVMIMLIGGITVFSDQRHTFAVVGLDVNPSVELKVNRHNKVITADAVNADGEDVLDGMDLRGTDINTACNAVVGAMLTKGYLSTSSNSVLLSVRGGNAQKGEEIEHTLAENLNTYLGSSEISASVMGQYIDDEDEIEAFAEANSISEGKAWLIHSLLASGSTKMSEESLLKLSTQELILLGQEKGISSTVYGSADTSKYVGRDKAADAALASAGLSRSQVSGIRVEYDTEDGRIIYEVEFEYDGAEYEYDIDAVSGEVISSDKEAGAAGGDYDDDADDNDDDSDDSDDDDADDNDADDDDDKDDEDDDDD